MRRVLNDSEVAEFVAEFQKRDNESQRCSPLWGVLCKFPAWKNNYKSKTVVKVSEPTDENPNDLGEVSEEVPSEHEAEVWDEEEEEAEVSAPAAAEELLMKKAQSTMTSDQMVPKGEKHLPPPPKVSGYTQWRGINVPHAGSTFVPKLDGKIPPPGPGWKELEDGWFRKE